MRTFLLCMCLFFYPMAGGADNLPDPLVTSAGEQITSPTQWPTRRAELLELFTTQLFGRAPIGRPDNMSITVTDTTPGMMNGAAERRIIRITWKGPGGESGMDVVLFVPTNRPQPVGCFLLIRTRPREEKDLKNITGSMRLWPAETIISRGYATATIWAPDIAPDNRNAENKSGIFAVFDSPDQPRAPDAWGTIAAWAWGASRAIDALLEQSDIDPKRIAVLGHSRGGKTALWCGANDERVALTISNNSGQSGAAISRGKKGESVARINETFPHWFNANYKRYGNREDELPFDQHELLALCAPRLVYVASATKDAWADPHAEFRSTVAATPVWKLFGLEGMTATEQPAPDTPLHDGRIGYHLRTGKHDLSDYDWQQYLDFADKHLK